MQSNERIWWLLGGLAAVGALWIYSRTEKGAQTTDDAVADGLDFVNVTASRIKNGLLSRGYRNNNPGNLRYLSKNAWNGQTANDNGYAVYDTPQNGTRALGHQLLKYANTYGANTVRSIINRWAPPIENNTSAYVGDVATKLNVDPDAQIDVEDRLADLALAIARHENGYVDDNYDFSWVYLA